jgi:hypothetical protein
MMKGKLENKKLKPKKAKNGLLQRKPRKLPASNKGNK